MFHRNCLLKNVTEENIEGMIDVKDGKENVSQYWMTLGIGDDFEN
jgi:hypothetical protein